jgi:hypothetical protein
MPTELLPLAILLAIAPGYMTIYFASHGRTGRPLEPDLRLVLQSLVVSAVLLAAIGPYAYASLWPIRNQVSDHPLLVTFWMVVIFLVIPFLLGRASGIIVGWVRTHPTTQVTKLFRQVVPAPIPPTLWDWAALSGVLEGKFVVIEFADGRRIGGAHGPPGVSMTSPEQHALYLAVEWELDQNGVPVRRLESSSGVLVPLDRDVRSIRIFTPGDMTGEHKNE